MHLLTGIGIGTIEHDLPTAGVFFSDRRKFEPDLISGAAVEGDDHLERLLKFITDDGDTPARLQKAVHPRMQINEAADRLL